MIWVILLAIIVKVTESIDGFENEWHCLLFVHAECHIPRLRSYVGKSRLIILQWQGNFVEVDGIGLALPVEAAEVSRAKNTKRLRWAIPQDSKPWIVNPQHPQNPKR
eukprot:610040-Amphidinium_carterae.1